MFFSVIVPIYKVSLYLENCIKSVLAQTFTDFELILVDDGSPDECPKICDEFAKKDGRITVIHKKNGGLVSARQAGIQVAKGEYVFNLDGDDALTPNALEDAFDIIKRTNAEIVSFAYKISELGKISEPVYDLVNEGLFNKQDIKKHIFPNLLLNENMQHMFYFLWGRAIKKSLLIKHQLNVNPAISLGEDLSCILPCFLEAESVYFCNKTAYLYTIRHDSISTSFNTAQITQIADVINGLESISLQKPNDFDMQISRYSLFMCFAIIAAAAEGGFLKVAKEIKALILNSIHKEKSANAKFKKITAKSSISIFLIKKGCIKTAFVFLFLCKKIKKG